MKQHKKAISYILSFVLSLCIIAAFLLGYINSSIFNEVNVRKAMRDTNYYYNIYSLIKDIANDYVLQSGFDENVLDGVITDIQVQSDMNRVIDGLYNHQKIEVNTDEIQKKLHENIQKQIEEQNHNVDENTQADIDEFENSIIDAYKTNMYYSQETATNISNKLYKIKKATNLTVISLCVIIVLLGFIIFKINEPAIGISFITSGIVFIIIKTYSGVNLAINNILMLNWVFSRTATFILNHLVQKIFVTGIVLVIAGIIAILISEYMRFRKDN